jgi:hypothetical protein
MYTWLLASHDAVSTTFTRLVVPCNVMRSGLPSLVMPCRIVLDGHDIEPGQSMRLRMGKHWPDRSLHDLPEEIVGRYHIDVDIM